MSKEEKQQSTKFKTGDVTLISLTHLLHDIYSSFLAPLRPLLIEKFGISLSVAALWDLVQRLPWFFNPILLLKRLQPGILSLLPRPLQLLP